MNCIFKPIWFNLKELKKIVLGEKKVEQKNLKKKYRFLYSSRYFFCNSSKTFSISNIAVLGFFDFNFFKATYLDFLAMEEFSLLCDNRMNSWA